jgi:hypothetical protein
MMPKFEPSYLQTSARKIENQRVNIYCRNHRILQGGVRKGSLNSVRLDGYVCIDIEQRTKCFFRIHDILNTF